MTKGINLENVKVSNRASVLKMLSKRGAMSRKDLAAEIGLTAATMTLICSELLEEGILIELGEADQETKRAGRKKILVDINKDYKKVLCISIELEDTYISLSNLGGEIIDEQDIATDSWVAPEEFVSGLASICKDLMWAHNVAQDEILAVGVTIPGRVDREAGVATNAYGIWDKPVQVGQLLEQELGFPVVVENNVRAYAESELVHGAGRELDNFLLLKWGPGVGAGIIIDGQVYQGVSGSAAEIGHMIAVKNGRQCSCGKRGCLETLISNHAFRQDATEAMSEGKMTVLKKWLDDHKVEIDDLRTREWAVVDDPELAEMLDYKIHLLAVNACNLVCVLNPTRLVIYGGMFDIPGFRDKFLSAYREFDPNVADDFIEESQLSDRVYYYGPLAIVMNEMIFNV